MFKQKLQYARDVRDGKIVDKSFVPIIFEHPPEMVKRGDHLKVENLAMVNPNLGYSVDRAFLEREFRKAQEGGEESFRGFMAKHGNVEIGLALRSNSWAGALFWEQQARTGLTLRDLIRRCEVIDAGIDGGGLDDLLGLAAAGRDRETGEWLTWCKAWAHPTVLERRKSEASKLLDLQKVGELVIVERIGEDVEQLAEDVKLIYDAGLLDKIGVDPSGIGAVLDALEAVGIPRELVIGISQGYKLNGTIKTTERKLAEGALWHGGTALMNWCVGNAKVEPKGNAILITKQASGTAKIDPLMALFNAVELLSLNPEAKKSSVYESRGIRFL
ncbi:terminase TerL endonuclease subunit [Cupriavidus sp. HPC(L)]|uniref:terminase TerL endonuclease subunit n=1 Tax=Cupriavidus sp. HPC(L) TaxID=1217418 RepID=UPI00029173EC